jgi:acyl-CoA thioester hydrolase
MCGLYSRPGVLSPVSTFQWPIRVYYEDTDSGGVVYYANYLRFMERARTEWLRALGFEQDRLVREEGLLFAVRSASIEFLRPARFNDLLTVISGLQHRGRASLTFAHSIIRQHEASQPCCTGEVKIACINADTFRPQAIPDTLLKELADVD